MDKVAEYAKYAEVRGALSAFCDAGLIKVASAEAFDDLCDTVSYNLGDEDYDLQKVAAVTGAVLEGSSNMNDIELARNAALGELFLAKTAGQISDDYFVDTAANIIKQAEEAAGGTTEPGRLRKAWTATKEHIGRNPKKYMAAGGLAAVGTGALLDELYHRYKSR